MLIPDPKISMFWFMIPKCFSDTKLKYWLLVLLATPISLILIPWIMIPDPKYHVKTLLAGQDKITYCMQFILLTVSILETFQLGKVHKDIAMFMVESAKDENSSDQSFIKVILFFVLGWQMILLWYSENCSTLSLE